MSIKAACNCSNRQTHLSNVMLAPPSFEFYDSLPQQVKDIHANLQTVKAGKIMSGIMKMNSFILDVEFVLSGEKANKDCLKNIYAALDPEVYPQGLNHVPIDTLLDSVLKAIELDKAAVRASWEKVRDNAAEQVVLFGGADRKRARLAD